MLVNESICWHATSGEDESQHNFLSKRGVGALTDVADDITTTIERLRETKVQQRRVIERRQLHILRCDLDSEIFIRFDILKIYWELELYGRLVVDGRERPHRRRVA